MSSILGFSIGVFAIVLPMLAIPVIAALIYKVFYNRHLNKQLESGVRGKSWISPFALGLIIFLAQVLIVIGLGMTYMTDTSRHSVIEYDSPDDRSAFYTQEEVANTPYASFRGGPVSGYWLKEETEGDFHYFIYENDDSVDNILPKYVVLVEYKGNGGVKSAVGTVRIGSSGQGFLVPASDRYVAVVDTGSMKIYNVDEDGNRTEISEEEYAEELKDSALELSLYNLNYDYMESHTGWEKNITADQITIPLGR